MKVLGGILINSNGLCNYIHYYFMIIELNYLITKILVVDNIGSWEALMHLGCENLM